jgi:hypothetical protein
LKHWNTVFEFAQGVSLLKYILQHGKFFAMLADMNYQTFLKQAAARRAKVVRLWAKYKHEIRAAEKVGAMMEPPISRQRVKQIVKSHDAL